MSRIFVVGDTHGITDIEKLMPAHFPIGETLTRDDYVIICGDTAIVWDDAMFDSYIQQWYKDKPWTTLFVDGNHDNHNLLTRHRVSEWHGGKVHQISPHIIHLMRGECYDIGGHSFFTFGGAPSHDKYLRTKDVDWWEGEIPTLDEFEHGFNTLDGRPQGVDFILTHEAPDYGVDQLGFFEHNIVSNYLETVRRTTKFKQWFFGHYHHDAELEGNLGCLYYDIVEIKEDGTWERKF